MKITSINNTVNFGYNKQLNDTVNKKLEHAKGNKELAKTLLDMNKFCNETEDKIRKAENEKNFRLVDIYTPIFLNIKPLITESLNARFPQLNYRKTELADYEKEIKERQIKDDFHWLKETAYELKDDEEFEEMLKSPNSKPLMQINVMAQKTQPAENTTNESEAKTLQMPSSLEKFTPTEYSPKGFSSLGGMDAIKATLTDKIIYPILEPEMAKLDEVEYGKKQSRGELFYGPPGCGKTAIIQALAMESKLPLYNLKIAKTGSKYINESSNNIQKAYEYAMSVAKSTGKPVLLAMDEMESLAGQRGKLNESGENDKMVSTLLQIIEEARGNGVIFIGATNCFDDLDDAIKSRFEDKIYIGLPDEDTRKAVLKVLLNKRTKGQALAKNDEELAKVVQLTKGFSNRDLTILTDKASLIARADKRRDIIADDFIIPVKENNNMKVDESKYKAASDKSQMSRSPIGFKR